MQNKLGFVTGLLLAVMAVSAQEIDIKGGFQEDSISIGVDVNYWITATYPLQYEMIFPDTLFDFSPYEFVSKRYFETQIINGLAFDSAVYRLQSFEIDSLQYLQLPVFLIANADTTIINSTYDSLFFSALAPIVTDTTQLVTNTDFLTVKKQFNTPLLYILVGVLLIIAIIVTLIFGPKIKRYFKLKKLRKEFQQFSDKITAHIREIKNSPDYTDAENALLVWKKYMEKLEQQPFGKWTSAEILALDYSKELKDTLKSIDRVVYGQQKDQNIYKAFQMLEDFAQHRYNLKISQISNGQK